MGDMNLKDFRPDLPDPDNEPNNAGEYEKSRTSSYQENVHSLRIDKLSNRVTIISVILPCLVGAILFFAYLDMKEKVTDADLDKKNQVEQMSLQIEEQLNALDIRVAKNRFDLDNALPEADKKITAMNDQLTKITASKADAAIVKDQLAKLETRVANNTGQSKIAFQTIERIQQEMLSSQAGLKTGVDQQIKQMNQGMTDLKKSVEGKIVGLAAYEQQLAELKKNLSLMDKKLKSMEQDMVSQARLDDQFKRMKEELSAGIASAEKQIQALDKKLTGQIAKLQKDMTAPTNAAPAKAPLPTVTEPVKPKPQIHIEPSAPTRIQQQPLTE